MERRWRAIHKEGLSTVWVVREPGGAYAKRGGMGTREDPSDLALRGTHGRLQGAEEGFPQRFPSTRRGHLSFTHLYSHTHRRWGSIAAAAQPRIEAAGGRRPYGIRKGRPRMYEYGYDTLWVEARNGPWDTHMHISSELLGLNFTPKGLSWLETSCNTIGNRPSVPPAARV
jgi:hypothetical protein